MSVNDYDIELYEEIHDLLDEGLLEEKTPAHGIALRAVDYGYESLTPNQRFVYDRDIFPMLRQRAEEIEIMQRKNSWHE